MKKPLVLLLCLVSIILFSTIANSQSFGSNNPVTCNGNEGFITIGGLIAGATYSVSYTDDGASVGPLSLTANTSGQIIISSLNAGLYSNFSLVYNGSTTNLFIGIVLSNPIFIPTFASIPPMCAGATPPVLPSISTNGISGTWNPAVIDNTTSGSYTFTPAAGQCGIQITIPVTSHSTCYANIQFRHITQYLCGRDCAGFTQAHQQMELAGTWNPAVVDDSEFRVLIHLHPMRVNALTRQHLL